MPLSLIHSEKSKKRNKQQQFEYIIENWADFFDDVQYTGHIFSNKARMREHINDLEFSISQIENKLNQVKKQIKLFKTMEN